jgi:hypothetical protein
MADMPDDDRIAVHESGHAMLACVLNLPLDHVQVGRSPRYDLVDGLHLRDPASRLNRIRILAAGGEAEMVVFGGEPIGDGSDIKQIADLLKADDDEAQLRGEVRRLLELNSGTLRWLAAKLARCGRLSGDEVEALVRGAKTLPRGHP